MAQVSMQQVKELRDRTQAGLNDCRSALVEADGDTDKAIEIILKKGLAKSAKRAGAVATEGLVLAGVAAGAQSGVLVEVNIQTDFAARNQDFVDFANKVLQVAGTADEGTDLGALPFPGGSASVEETRQALVGRLGENIHVRRWQRLRVAGPGKVHSYVHMGGKIGVIVGAKLGQEKAASHEAFNKFLDDVAMQIAAMSPQYLKGDEVTADALAKQQEIFAAQLAEEGKPEQARPKIVEGKISKWKKEVCLLEQQSVLESEKSVAEVCKSVAATLGTTVELVGFLRYECGEGIAKAPAADFASEVAKMAGN